MRKIISSFILAFTILLVPFVSLQPVHAATHSLDDLHIHVSLQEDGSAQITETRKATLSEGTENYIVIGNLGKSEIKDFTVSEGGETFDALDTWDIDATREEKAYKSGVLKTKDGYELCWGIGDYGEHEYVIEYVVTDFIKQLDDSQVMFWRFVNDEMNIPPKNVTIEIESAKQLSDVDERIWAFGYTGDIEFIDGKVVARSESPLNRDNYVTILVQFTDEIFTTGDHLGQSFAEIQELAFEGSDYGQEEKGKFGGGSFLSGIVSLFISFFQIIIVGGVIIAILFFSVRSKSMQGVNIK